MHRRFRASLAAGLLTCIFASLALAAGVASAGVEAAVAVVHLDGRGHGHGVGLSQWGAYTMALDGASAPEILSRFYPGTTIGSMAGEVPVVVDVRSSVRVSLPQGGQLRSARDGGQAEGFPIDLAPREVVEIVHDGSGYRVIGANVQAASRSDAQRFSAAAQGDDCVLGVCVGDGDNEDGGQDDPPGDGSDDEPEPEPEPEPCTGLLCRPSTPTAPAAPTTTTTTQPPAGDEGGSETDPDHDQPPSSTTTAPPPSAPRSTTPIWAIPVAGGTVHSFDRGRTYRGVFELYGQPGEMRIRNHVDVEDYLKGMAEVPSAWPAAAVQAQTVAARTYALRAVVARGELCDSEACQVYEGVARETPGQVAAVEATRGWVVTYNGALASTFYSASGGGYSATIREGFGSDYDVPYLQAAPYETDNPKDWQVDIALTDVAARMHYPGDVTEVRVTATGPSGRPVSMELVGDAGVMEIDPQDFRRQLGLQSTLFTVSGALTDEPPPPPPPPMDDQLTTAGESSQLDAIIDVETEELVDPTLDQATARLAEVASGQAGVLPTAESGSSIALVSVLAMLLLAAGTALTGHRLTVLGRHVGADGLDGTVQGAPVMGIRRQLAATITRWRSPDV